jgi:hypothetical protein
MLRCGGVGAVLIGGFLYLFLFLFAGPLAFAEIALTSDGRCGNCSLRRLGLPPNVGWTKWSSRQVKSLGKRVNSLEMNNRGGAFRKFFENAG